MIAMTGRLSNKPAVQNIVGSAIPAASTPATDIDTAGPADRAGRGRCDRIERRHANRRTGDAGFTKSDPWVAACGRWAT